jgi:hypothetical protein
MMNKEVEKVDKTYWKGVHYKRMIALPCIVIALCKFSNLMFVQSITQKAFEI